MKSFHPVAKFSAFCEREFSFLFRRVRQRGDRFPLFLLLFLLLGNAIVPLIAAPLKATDSVEKKGNAEARQKNAPDAVSPTRPPSPLAPLPELTAKEKKFLNGIGGKLLPDGNIKIDSALIDRRSKWISFPAIINIRKGPIEVLVSSEKGRTHESLFISKLDPFKLQLALILSGYRNGPMLKNGTLPQGSEFQVFVQIKDGKMFPADEWLYNNSKSRAKDLGGYIFVGSDFRENVCLASLQGNLLNINSNDDSTILNAFLTPDNVHDEYTVLTEKLPPLRNPPQEDEPDPVAMDHDFHVTLILRPSPVDAQPAERATQKEGDASSVPRVDSASETSKASDTTLTGKSIDNDYLRLMRANSINLSFTDPAASKKILEDKILLTEQFLKLYEKKYDHENYGKALRLKEALEEMRKLQQPVPETHSEKTK